MSSSVASNAWDMVEGWMWDHKSGPKRVARTVFVYLALYFILCAFVGGIIALFVVFTIPSLIVAGIGLVVFLIWLFRD